MVNITFDPKSYRVLNLQGSIYDSFQRTRIVISNRFGNTRLAPLAAEYGLNVHLDAIKGLEEEAADVLKRLYIATVSQHILEWQSASPGIGELQLARLLGRTGHPRVAFPKHWEEGKPGEDKKVLVEGEPYARSLRQFWAFCGLGDPARKRYKNMTQAEALALGDPEAKKIMWLIATSVMRNSGSKQTVPPKPSYRVVYDAAKIHYAERTHAEPCVRCGPSGHPALVGSPWSAGHQHAASLRKMMKEILRDLWIKGCEEVPIEEEERIRYREVIAQLPEKRAREAGATVAIEANPPV